MGGVRKSGGFEGLIIAGFLLLISLLALRVAWNVGRLDSERTLALSNRPIRFRLYGFMFLDR